jgi:hypothetical protein
MGIHGLQVLTGVEDEGVPLVVESEDSLTGEERRKHKLQSVTCLISFN